MMRSIGYQKKKKNRRRKVDEKSCVTPALVLPTNLTSRINGKKTHTHTTVGCECVPVIWTLPFIVFSGVQYFIFKFEVW